MNQSMELGAFHRGSCFALLGFDVLLDRDGRPWLLEVNISPSLRCDTSLDHDVKSAVLTDTLNIISIPNQAAERDMIATIGLRSARTSPSPSF